MGVAVSGSLSQDNDLLLKSGDLDLPTLIYLTFHRSWLIEISPHRYASEAMLWTVFSGKTFDDYAECLQASSQANSTAVCYGESGGNRFSTTSATTTVR